MNEAYKLTIAVITMNRSEQLVEALDSCMACALPEKTEFVILDNASTDKTKQVMEQYISEHPHIPIHYFYSPENLGVGGGRSYVFDKAQGEFVYFLDDDAVIAPESKDSFFVESLRFMEKHESVASMTTQIYDEVFGYKRTAHIPETNKIDGMPVMFIYFGGSHFLRKRSFDSPLYFPLQYSSEEYAPSIRAMNKGLNHVFNKNISIIHKPKVNKWVDGTEKMRRIQICCAAVVYATKKLLYPTIFLPILWAGYERRCEMYLKEYPGAKKEADAMVKQIVKENKTKKIHISTVVKMYRNFGLTVF